MTEPIPMPTPPLELLTLEVSAVPAAAISGFPCPIVLVLRNPATATVRAGLPGISDLGPPTELRARWRGGSRVLAEREALPVGVRFGIAATFTLQPGAARRMLVDLSELFDELPCGRGELEIDYQRSSGRCALSIEAPGGADRRFAARRPPNRSWRATLLSQPVEPGVLEQLSPLACETLALYLAQGVAVRAALLSEVDERLFEQLPKTLAPEAAASRYELAVSRNEPSSAALRAATVQRWPEIGWRLDEVDAWRGNLKLLREMFGDCPVEPPPLARRRR